MLIILASPDTIRLGFRYNPATVEAVKGLLGSEFDKDSKVWTTKLCHLRRLASMFPTAQIEQAAINARIEQWGRVVQGYNQLGIWFCLDVDAETVVPVGRGVSPVFAEWCAAHSGQIGQWLHIQRFPTADPGPVNRMLAEVAPVEVSPADKQLWSAIQNASRREERKAEIVEQRRKVRRKATKASVQMELISE